MIHRTRDPAGLPVSKGFEETVRSSLRNRTTSVSEVRRNTSRRAYCTRYLCMSRIPIQVPSLHHRLCPLARSSA